ncbi:unnamed protein product, partial [Musa textilis]
CSSKRPNWCCIKKKLPFLTTCCSFLRQSFYLCLFKPTPPTLVSLQEKHKLLCSYPLPLLFHQSALLSSLTMEGLIPFVYRAILHYAHGEEAPLRNSWLDESPSASYMRLPGDSGRLRSPEIHLLSSSPPAAA